MQEWETNFIDLKHKSIRSLRFRLNVFMRVEIENDIHAKAIFGCEKITGGNNILIHTEMKGMVVFSVRVNSDCISERAAVI